MKTLITFILATLTFTGCVAIEEKPRTTAPTPAPVVKVIPSKFDPVVNLRLADLLVMNKEAIAQCNKPSFFITATDLDRKANVIYASTRYAYPDLAQVTSVISANYREMLKTYTNGGVPPSETYCETKLKITGSSIERALTVLGQKQK